LTELDDVRVKRSARARARVHVCTCARVAGVFWYIDRAWSTIPLPLPSPPPPPTPAAHSSPHLARPRTLPRPCTPTPPSGHPSHRSPEVLMFHPPRDVTHPEKLGLPVTAGHTYSHVCRLSRRYMRHVTSVYFSSVSYIEPPLSPRYPDWIS